MSAAVASGAQDQFGDLSRMRDQREVPRVELGRVGLHALREEALKLGRGRATGHRRRWRIGPSRGASSEQHGDRRCIHGVGGRRISPRRLQIADDKKRNAFYRQLGKVIYDDAAYTFLFNRPTLDAVHRRVRGIRPQVPWYDFEDVWLADSPEPKSP